MKTIYAVAVVLIVVSLVWLFKGPSTLAVAAPETGAIIAPLAKESNALGQGAGLEVHMALELGRTPIEEGAEPAEHATPQSARLIGVDVRDIENGQVVRYPRCRISAGPGSRAETAPGLDSARDEIEGAEDGQLTFRLEDGDAWCWIGAEGYSWKLLYLGSEVDLPRIVALRSCGAIDVQVDRVSSDAEYLNLRAQVLDVYGSVVFERPLDPQARTVHFVGVPPGEYSVALVGALEASIEHGTVGVPVTVLRGETVRCSIGLPLARQNLLRVTGEIIYGTPMPGLHERGGISLKLVRNYPNAGLNGNRGTRFTFNVPVTLAGDGSGWLFGPMMIPPGEYVLHQGPVAYAWDVAISRDEHLELDGERPVTTYIECIDSATRLPVANASVTWSVYPTSDTPRPVATRLYATRFKENGVVLLNSMQGRLEAQISCRGYEVTSYSGDVNAEGGHHIVELEPASVVVLRAEDSLGNQLDVDPDWLSSATLISLAGEVVSPVLISVRKTIQYVSGATSGGSGAAGETAQRRRVGLADVAMTIAEPGEYLVVFPHNEGYEVLSPHRFECVPGVETEVVAVLSKSAGDTHERE